MIATCKTFVHDKHLKYTTVRHFSMEKSKCLVHMEMLVIYKCRAFGTVIILAFNAFLLIIILLKY